MGELRSGSESAAEGTQQGVGEIRLGRGVSRPPVSPPPWHSRATSRTTALILAAAAHAESSGLGRAGPYVAATLLLPSPWRVTVTPVLDTSPPPHPTLHPGPDTPLQQMSFIRGSGRQVIKTIPGRASQVLHQGQRQGGLDSLVPSGVFGAKDVERRQQPEAACQKRGGLRSLYIYPTAACESHMSVYKTHMPSLRKQCFKAALSTPALRSCTLL